MAKCNDNKIIVTATGFLIFLAVIVGGYYDPENIVEALSFIGILVIGIIGASTIMIIKNLKEIKESIE